MTKQEAAEGAAASPAKQRSQLARAFAEDGAVKTHVGGQALIEGVMIRGKLNWAAAVREPDGNIYVEEHDLASGKEKNRWLRLPLVRGCTALVESLMLGFKALEIAANHAYADEEEESGSSAAATPADDRSMREASRIDGEGTPASGTGAADEQPVRAFSWKRDFGNPDEMIDGLGAQRTLEVVCDAEPVAAEPAANAPASAAAEPASGLASDVAAAAPAEKEPAFSSLEMGLSLGLGLALGIALFIVLPAFAANLIVGEYDQNTLAWNIVDGALRVAVFVFYIWLIGRMKDIRRMFMYHGAEHKTIHCYEHGLPLTPENARQFPRLHVRCGTAFLIMVMIIAILVYTIVPLNALIGAWGVPDGAPKLALVIAARIVLMPVIAGVSYEITVKWAGSHPENPLVKVVLWPGMQMQYLTTNEPDDEQLACAIAAMKPVLERERRAAEAAA